jgi:hypothetical protein
MSDGLGLLHAVENRIQIRNGTGRLRNRRK